MQRLLAWLIPLAAAGFTVLGFFLDGLFKQFFGIPDPAFQSAPRPSMAEIGGLLQATAGVVVFLMVPLLTLALMQFYLVGRFDYFNRKALDFQRDSRTRDDRLGAEFMAHRQELQSYILVEHEKIRNLTETMVSIGDSVLKNDEVAAYLAPLRNIREHDGSVWMELAIRKLNDNLAKVQEDAADIGGGVIPLEGEAAGEMEKLFRAEQKRIRAVSNFDIDGLEFWETRGQQYLSVHREVSHRAVNPILIERVFVFRMGSVTDGDWAKWRSVVQRNLEAGVVVRVFDEARTARRDLLRDIIIFGDRVDDDDSPERPVLFRVLKVRDDMPGAQIIRTGKQTREAIDNFVELWGMSDEIVRIEQFDALRANA